MYTCGVEMEALQEAGSRRRCCCFLPSSAELADRSDGEGYALPSGNTGRRPHPAVTIIGKSWKFEGRQIMSQSAVKNCLRDGGSLASLRSSV